MPRGGKRKNAGRRRRGGGWRQVSHGVSHQEVEAYGAAAKREGVSRAAWIREQCRLGLMEEATKGATT